MKKTQIATQISKICGLPKYECLRMLDAFQEVVTDALCNNEKVVIRGFMTLEVGKRNRRKGFNPASQEKVILDPVKTVKFRIGKPIKEAINSIID